MTAFCEAPGFQPWTVPSSVTQMKRAGLPGARRKSAGLPLNITPVGDPGAVWLGALATITVPVPLIGTIIAAPVVGSMRYSVEVPPALFETHHGEPPGLATRPQAFCRLGSMTPAGGVLAKFATRLVWV